LHRWEYDLTFTDNNSFERPVAPAADLDGNPVVREASVVDTTELRWFIEGPLTAEVETWFTRDGTTGAVEKRYDTYRIEGRCDVGVKRRFGETLELKVRQSLGETLALDPDLSGRLEVWRKWSPADGLVDAAVQAPWLDVHKMVIKRRFSVGGDEIVLTNEARAMTGAGCDVEVADVTVGDVEAYTFAFAAFGPTTTRRDSIVACWQALSADTKCPERLTIVDGRSSGYPEWLAHVTAPIGAGG
jgi:hypothetical protein